MNKGQIATAIGQRLGVDTSSAATRDGAAVRSSLQIRHDQLYRAFLWRDSVLEMELPINAAYTPISSYLPTKARILLPAIFQHVLGVRLGWRSLDVQRPMLYYRADYGRFMHSGHAAQFSLLSSCVWEFDTPQALIASAANPADNGAGLTLDELQADGVSVVRSAVPAASAGTPAGNTDRLDAFLNASPAPKDNMLISVATAAQTNLVPAGTSWPAVIPNGGATVAIGGFVKGLSYFYAAGNETYFSRTVAGVPSLNIQPGAFVATQNTYYLIGNAANAALTAVIYATTQAIIQIQPTDVAAPRCQRVQLVGRPDPEQDTRNLHILGKRSTPPFAADTDIPGISGLDGVLFALGYYDFKQRDESGGSADAVAALGEAVGPQFLTTGKPGGFLGKLIEEEVIQAAYNCRIVPDHGFGGEDYFNDPYGSKGHPYG